MKVSELTGAQLDAWVARAEGIPMIQQHGQMVQNSFDEYHLASPRRYSADWAHGGPLIEKYKMYVDGGAGPGWEAQCMFNGKYAHGDTALKAICRAVVLQKFGEDVPEQPK